MWEMAWVVPALLMSRTPSSIHGGCDPARSTSGHTHNIACAFYEDFSDLALVAASPTALRWALLVLVHQEERQRDQERRAGRARRPQHDIRVQPPVAMGSEQLVLFECATLCLQMRMRHPYDLANSIPDLSRDRRSFSLTRPEECRS